MVKNMTLPINEHKGVFVEIDDELDSPRVFVSLIDIKEDIVYQDLCGVRIENNENKVYVYGNENDEDYTDEFIIKDSYGKYI